MKHWNFVSTMFHQYLHSSQNFYLSWQAIVISIFEHAVKVELRETMAVHVPWQQRFCQRNNNPTVSGSSEIDL